MINKILKVGFRYLIIIIVIGAIAIVIPNTMIEKELQANDTQEEVPLQNAVEEKKQIENKVKSNNNKTTKIVKKVSNNNNKAKKNVKKTTKKVTIKKYVNAKIRRTSTNEYQNYAHNLVINQYGWSEYDFECLIKLWNRESGWNPNAHNKKSGAHGIPQSLPASKMASEGADYYTNGYTQIRWGLKYIKGRYGSPSKAWQHSQRKGWY